MKIAKDMDIENGFSSGVFTTDLLPRGFYSILLWNKMGTVQHNSRRYSEWTNK